MSIRINPTEIITKKYSEISCSPKLKLRQDCSEQPNTSNQIKTETWWKNLRINFKFI